MSGQIAASTLRHVESLKKLSTRTLDALAQCADSRRFRSGDAVVDHLDQSRDFYIVVSGRVRVGLIASNGRVLTYQILGSGEMFGEVAAIDGLPRTASVVAEDESVLVKIESQSFHQLFENHADFAMVITQKLVRLNRWLIEQLFEYHAFDVKGRVYAELLRLTESDPTADVTITDRDLASRVGTTRENVTRIHADLKRKGLIKRRQSSLRVLDRTRFESMLKDCEFS